MQDVSGARFTFVIAAADAEALFRDLYNGTILDPAPTPPPDAGGGTVFFDSIYLRQIGAVPLDAFIFTLP